jgi:hypothetical protein
MKATPIKAVEIITPFRNGFPEKAALKGSNRAAIISPVMARTISIRKR